MNYTVNTGGNKILHPKRKSRFILLLVFFVLISSFALYSDTAEQVERYRYALGLFQRGLFDESARVLKRLINDPAPFSQLDGAIFWLAECKYRYEDYSNAIKYYEKLIKEHPNSQFKDRAAYGLGWAHTENNNPLSAVEAYLMVSRQDIDLWIDANFKAGHLMMKYDMEPARTVEIYEKLLKEDRITKSQRFEAHLQAGISQFNRSIFAMAYEHFKKALELTPEDKKQPLLFYTAESLFRYRQYKQAAKYYKKVIDLIPTTSLAQKSAYSLAWCFINTQKHEKAVTLFEQQASNPHSVVRDDSLTNLVELLMNMQDFEKAITWAQKASRLLPEPQKPPMAYIAALALARTGSYIDSLEALKKFVADYPQDKRKNEAIYQKGLVLIALGEFKRAYTKFNRVSKSASDKEIVERAIYRMGECEFNQGNIMRATKYFRRVISDFESGNARFDALYQLGELAYMQSQFDDAINAFSVIIDSGNPLSSQALFRSGEVFMMAGDNESAVAHFEEYINRYPDGELNEDALFKKGVALVDSGQSGRALAIFSQLLDGDSYFKQEARYNIAQIAEEMENYPLAIQNYRALVEDEPEHPLASRAKRSIGISFYKMNDYESAIGEFRKVLTNYPPTDAAIPESRYWLGKSIIMSGEIEDGILEILRVPVFHSDTIYAAKAYVAAAKGYEKLGDSIRAKAMWNKVLLSNPTGELEILAREHINKD